MDAEIKAHVVCLEDERVAASPDRATPADPRQIVYSRFQTAAVAALGRGKNEENRI